MKEYHEISKVTSIELGLKFRFLTLAFSSYDELCRTEHRLDVVKLSLHIE